ncbi:MAG TPA: glutaredoxin 3 [Kiloniellales bacterium]|nr:glutaredoxin 3 [Kiloniellales bacterium]
MPKIEIYTTFFCPFCFRAKKLLDRKGLDYQEIDAGSAQVRAKMRQRAGRNSVPQIFIDERHVGGCDDLYALEASGELDRLLQDATA